MPVHLGVLTPRQDCVAGQLCTVVADTMQWTGTTNGDDRLQLPRNALAGQRRVGDQAKALSAEVINDDQNPEPPTVGQRVGAKSNDHRWFGPRGSVIGARVPRARLRPPRRRT